MTRPSQARRHNRFDVEGVAGNFLFSVNVNVQNLSVSGMAVEASRALAVGRRYMFNLVRGNELLRLGARVAWCVLGGSRKNEDGDIVPVFHAGVQFENVLTGDASDLMHLIEKAAVLEVNQRIFGRFHPFGTSASMNAAVDFTVCQISISGMLLEIKGFRHDFAVVDAILPLEFKIGDAMVSTDGRVAFVGEPDGKKFRMGWTTLGIEFVDIPPSALAILEDYIASVVEA